METDTQAIAICGIGLRLPGGVQDAESFWDLLMSKTEARTRVPANRFNVENFYSEHQKPGTVKMQHGYFLNNNFEHFDASFFSMTARETARLDPQQRLILEVVRECFENAGETQWRGSRTACMIGTFGQDWSDMQSVDKMNGGLYNLTGQGDFLLSNRVSYEYDLKGESFTVKTGCSAALLAFHLACQSLIRGDCNAAIAGGTNLILAPGMSIVMTEQGIVSSEGRSKTFDADADGYGRGEAINCVYIKRLEDAIRDRNPIRAVVRSTASNCDGKSANIASPSSEAHEQLMRQAYEKARLSERISETPFVECHGTGTAVGDPLEVAAIAKVFGSQGTYIGSVKPNVGHSEGASGITSLIKAILTLEHGIIPPNINFRKPNPQIPFETAKLIVPVDPLPWPEYRSKRVSVNSFGLGGANVHVILESADAYLKEMALPRHSTGHVARLDKATTVLQKNSNGVISLHGNREIAASNLNGTTGSTNGTTNSTTNGTTNGMMNGTTNGTGSRTSIVDINSEVYKDDDVSTKGQMMHDGESPCGIRAVGPDASAMDRPNQASIPQKVYFIVLSANQQTSLSAMHERYNTYIREKPQSLFDLEYTLLHRREHLRYRSYALVDTRQSTKIEFFPNKIGRDLNVVFVFTGQGAQWPRMGIELAQQFPSFREDLFFLDNCLATLTHPPDWRIYDELSKYQEESRISAAEISQPLCTALQICLVNLWSRLGVTPCAVIGHSSGEIAAAYAAAALTMTEAIRIAYFRGTATLGLHKKGSMAAIGLSASDTLSYLAPGAVVACENSPSSTTISGDAEAVESTLKHIKTKLPDAFTRLLRVDKAYHSSHMEEIAAYYHSSIESIVTSSVPHIPVYSSVSGEAMKSVAEFDAAYWVRNLVSPVLFSSALCKLLDENKSGNMLFLEVGPHASLASAVRQTCRDAKFEGAYVTSVSRGKNSYESMLHAVGKLHTQKVSIDFGFINNHGRVLVDLPNYQWLHDASYWDENRLSKEWRMRRSAPHDLLGLPVVEWNELFPTWRNVLRLEELSWIRGHSIGTDTVLPGAAYVCLAGEACSQLTGTASFRVRNVVIGAAMILNNAEPRELMTCLRKKQMTDSSESKDYEFSVCSLSTNSQRWIKHCWGEVGAAADASMAMDLNNKQFSRKVDSDNWYGRLSKIGLNYTGPFHGLRDITVAPMRDAAQATIHNQMDEVESHYELHPSTIDVVFQLFSVAASRGITYALHHLSVPTFIEELYIGGSASTLKIEAMSDKNSPGSLSGDAIGVADGRVILELKGLKSSPLDSGSSSTQEPHSAVQLHWKPHFDFLSTEQLIHPINDHRESVEKLEQLLFLYALDCVEKSRVCEPPLDHLNKLQRWLQEYVETALKNKNALLDQSIMEIKSDERHAFADSLYKQLLQTIAKPCAIALNRNWQHYSQILDGNQQGLEILMEDGILNQIYSTWGFDYSGYLSLLGHKQPTMRVLEIGAGTGGTTSAALEGLRSDTGEAMFNTYVYTDISAGFFSKAQERFSEYHNMEFKILDISECPVNQGFVAESFDLIIASNVLHATPCLSTTLQNVRRLLRPGGQLLMQELAPISKWINFIVGTLPGWWLGESDNRPDQPYVESEVWDRELRRAGFNGAHSVRYDNAPPYQVNVSITALAEAQTNGTVYQSQVVLLHDGSLSARGSEIEKHLEDNGFQVVWTAISDDIPSGDIPIVSLLDLQSSYLNTTDEHAFQQLLKSLSSLVNRSIIWVMEASQIDCQQPNASLFLGLARTLRSELSLDLSTLEIPDLAKNNQFLAPLLKLINFLPRRYKSDISNYDYEYAVSNDTIMIPRFRWMSVNRELGQISSNESKYARAFIQSKGLFQTLQWSVLERKTLLPDELRVAVRATGLNFKDLLIAMGIINDDALGLEAAGIVIEVGPAVGHVAVGDEVALFSNASLATEIVTKDYMCVKMAPHLSFQEAASMLCTYSTVIRSLVDVGRLESDQTVLIHSACGGVGIAAINIAKMIGAKIYATVGSVSKREHLVKIYGIPPDHIFNSRDTSFKTDVLHATGGTGVDLVLNSLSGDLLHASWECVARYGTLIELGKRDIIGRAKIDMSPFNENRSFISVDLARITADRPHLVKGLLQRTMTWCSEGKISPVHPIKTFAAENIESGFRYMQKGSHIGKIVFDMPTSHAGLTTVSQPTAIKFKSEASYLLPGGLGGLGQSVARWMVLNGTKSLVFLSRTGRSDRNEHFLRELESMGCNIVVVKGSSANIDSIQEMIDQAPYPIRGVMQLSMALRDRLIGNMTFEDWTAVLDPRVKGTWNLHNALLAADMPLDFFVLFSSICGLIGQRGQANYAASNTFMDAFVQYRQSMGLPASAINSGAVEDVGYVSQSQDTLHVFKSLKSVLLTEKDVLDSVHLAITRSHGNVSLPVNPHLQKDINFTFAGVFGTGLGSLIPLSDPSCRIYWKDDARMSAYRNTDLTHSQPAAAGGTDLRAFLGQIEQNPSMLNDSQTLEILSTFVVKTVYGFLMKDDDGLEDVNASFTNLGIDSLVAIELRNWLKQQFALEISVLQIMDLSSIQVANMVRESMQKKFGQELFKEQVHNAKITPEELARYQEVLQYKAP